MSQEIWKVAPVGVGILAIALIAGCPSGCSDTSSPPATVDTATGSKTTSSHETETKKPSETKRPATKTTLADAAPTAAAPGKAAVAKHDLTAPKPMLDGWAKP